MRRLLALGLAVLGGALALLVGAAWFVGSRLPVAHTAEVSVVLASPPATVWAAIESPEAFPTWRTVVDEVELLGPGPAGLPVWRERGASGVLTLAVTERIWGSLLRTRIADEGLPFGGSWLYRVEADGAGTRLTLREDGEVYPAVFRFVARFVIGHDATMRRYLADLERHLEETR